MKKFPLFLLITLQLLIIISHVNSQKPSSKPPALMWYVLTWPPTFCNNLRNAKCKQPVPQDIFTLHGLWPADASGKTINCSRGVDPDWDKLFRPREAKLNTFWPELKANQSKWSLWKHEWQKHGVCAQTSGITPEKYFDGAIRINEMFGKGNLFNYLKTSGITPSDSKTYTKEDITKAVQKVFTNSLPLSTIKSVLSSRFDPLKLAAPAFNIYLRCNKIDTQKAYLNEVVLCTILDGSSFISCPNRSTNCDSYAKIVLPTAKSVALPRSQEETYGTYPVFA